MPSPLHQAALATVSFLDVLPEPVLYLEGAEVYANVVALAQTDVLWSPEGWPAELLEARAQLQPGEAPRQLWVFWQGLPTLVTVASAGDGVLVHWHTAPMQRILQSLDRLRLGVTVHRQGGAITRWNEQALDILGLSAEQLSGRTPLHPEWNIVHPNGQLYQAHELPVMKALQTAQPNRDVSMGVYNPVEAARRWLTVTALPEPLGALTIFRDETEEQQLREQVLRSERRYRSLVQAGSQIVWNTDASGTISLGHHGWEAFTGQRIAEYASTSEWLEAVHPEDRERTAQTWQQALREEQAFNLRYRLRRFDGVYVPMQVRGVPVRDDQGRLCEWIGTHTDDTLAQAAEEALATLGVEGHTVPQLLELGEVTRFMAILLTSAGEGIFGLDAQGLNTFVNPAASRILGYGVRELLGEFSHQRIHHTKADGRPYSLEECPIHQTLQDGRQRQIASDIFWHAQGHPVPVSYTVTATHDDQGQINGAVVLFEDITEQLHAQEALQHAIHELRQSNDDLEQFAFVASHDLQEPLRTLGSYAELLSRRYSGQLDGRANQYLNFMNSAVKRLHSLIQDLLTFARIGRHELTMQQISLDEMIRGIEAELHSRIEEAGGELSWDTPHTIHGQPTLILQLFSNLISNGFKFQQPGVAPRVQVRSWSSSGLSPLLNIEVKDNGIGIAPEHQEQVFALFQRLHSREQYPGNGLGLAICRKIVLYHGGTLELASMPGQGSTFMVRLPQS